MAIAHEDDVVIAFRQALEEELRRFQEEGAQQEPLHVAGDPAEKNLERLVQSHERLQSEVALLRTVILKLVSQPVDTQNKA